MKELISNLKGDKVIWTFVALLALFSFMPVFSASSNLAYIGHGTGNTLGYLMKHAVHVIFGFVVNARVSRYCRARVLAVRARHYAVKLHLAVGHRFRGLALHVPFLRAVIREPLKVERHHLMVDLIRFFYGHSFAIRVTNCMRCQNQY